MTRARDLADGKHLTNVDSNTLVVDATNNRLGVGAASPSTKIHLNESGSANAVQRVQAGTDNYAAQVHLYGNNVSGASYNSVASFVNGDSTPQWEITGAEASAEDVMILHTGGTERMRLLSGGGVDISAGHLAVDNGYGIDFSAASSASGMTSEILDDYEEGTFTPNFSSGITSPGYLSQVGTYVKVGAMVICSVYLRANSGTENSDHIRIGGLPFAFTSATDHAYGAFFTYNGGFWTADNNVQWLGLSGNTTLAFYQQDTGGSITGTNSNVAANLNAACRLTAVYRTDA